MNGRLEKDLKIYNKIENTLEELPRFITGWYFYLKANNKTATTCQDYIRKARHFLQFINPALWRITIDSITDEKVIQYFSSIQFKEKNGKIEETSDSYKQSIWSCLNSLFSYLESTEQIDYNYIRKLKIERPENHDLDRINQHRILLTEQDFKSIFNIVDIGCGSNKAKGYQKEMRQRDKCILLLLMTTGMRKGALSTINIEDIDFDNKQLFIIDKGKSVQTYPLSDNVLETINDWIIDRSLLLCGKEKSALFISRYGERLSLNGIDKIIKKYSNESLGYEISPHKIRSGFISIFQSHTHDIEQTRRAAGHKNISTTQRYIVTENKERVKASKTIDGILF